MDDAALFSANTPAAFWRVLATPMPAASEWSTAVGVAARLLPPAVRRGGDQIDDLLLQILGEGQFGPRHWRLDARRRLYYALKPMLPRALTRVARRWHRHSTTSRFPLGWPEELRYPAFLWEVIRQLLLQRGQSSLPYIGFWPSGRRYALVLTHDVETAAGQRRVRELADLDAAHGLRSSFNFVPERYPLDDELMSELRARGFEVGIHGLHHDGKLFSSHGEFMRRAERINQYLEAWGAVGFRAPLMHRNPAWLQALDIEYDLSFFDTDPYEPIAGGTMSLWPFQLGRFVELPYTLVQDYTLTAVLKETSPRLWLRKLDAIRRYHGMALVNTHPDYLRDSTTRRVYTAFLKAVATDAGAWNALPRQVAGWWRARREAGSLEQLPEATSATIGSSTATAAAAAGLSLAS
jgi:peptidoglycan/xylan/chitin deacetylase (PgdA/CDA1 family)